MASPAVFVDRGFERRRPSRRQQLPMDALRDMPALVVLERLPTPTLAVDRTGSIVFANGAFCDMLGYTSDEMLMMNFAELFHGPSPDGTFAPFPSNTARLVELVHRDGHPVLAGMSKSAMRRADDAVALATFSDRSEELWLSGPSSAPVSKP
jgi:PAS domain S-box-containing protein